MKLPERLNIVQQIDEMIVALKKWFREHDYHYIECNYVPESLFSNHRKWNFFLRTLFRLFPLNLRTRKSLSEAPLTPQTQVALLKAYHHEGEHAVIRHLYKRIESLSSPKTSHFSLKQGIRIAINLYEDSADTPTPLNTVWLGQFLLEAGAQEVPGEEREEKLKSIAAYLVKELGYADYGEEGVYFYYGESLKKVIYNASALISAFLLRVGQVYSIEEYVDLGHRGIQFIINRQNSDGSWFYVAPPEHSTIDCFHQSYILQALQSCKTTLPELTEKAIVRGEAYYRTLFHKKGSYIIPQRYDKRYVPRNTWLFQSLDGRDIGEALIYFSQYNFDREMIEGLINYLYDKMFIKEEGYISPECFIYGRNRIPYSEFQAWYLYALSVVKQSLQQ